MKVWSVKRFVVGGIVWLLLLVASCDLGNPVVVENTNDFPGINSLESFFDALHDKALSVK